MIHKERDYWCCQAEVDGDYLGKWGHEQISRVGSLEMHELYGGKVHTLTREKFLQGLNLFFDNLEKYPLYNEITWKTEGTHYESYKQQHQDHP